MAAKPFIAARIPEELNLKLEDYSKTANESRTQILINALSAYIGYSQTQEGNSNSTDRLSRLEERVLDLEQLLKEARWSPSPDEREEESREQNTTEAEEAEGDNDIDNKPDNGSLEGGAVQGVIEIDNSIDNTSDNKLDNIPDNIQTTILDEVLHHPNSQYGEYLGQMKTNEVIALPVLKEMDKTKLRNKLSGVRRVSSRRVKIDPYMLFLTLVDKGHAKKQEYLWDVYKTENIPITDDNS